MRQRNPTTGQWENSPVKPVKRQRQLDEEKEFEAGAQYRVDTMASTPPPPDAEDVEAVGRRLGGSVVGLLGQSMWEVPDEEQEQEDGELLPGAEQRRAPRARYWRSPASTPGRATRVRAAAEEAAAQTEPCVVCAACGDHLAEQCPERRCDQCGRRGHLPAGCPYLNCGICERDSGEGGCACHNVVDARRGSAAGEAIGAWCEGCEQAGHWQCSVIAAVTSAAERTCYSCGEAGHAGGQCAAGGGGPGGGDDDDEPLSGVRAPGEAAGRQGGEGFMNVYAVARGRVPGLYQTSREVSAQTDRFPSGLTRRFDSLAAAVGWLGENGVAATWPGRPMYLAAAAAEAEAQAGIAGDESDE